MKKKVKQGWVPTGEGKEEGDAERGRNMVDRLCVYVG
jgi:hypothetical protein